MGYVSTGLRGSLKASVNLIQNIIHLGIAGFITDSTVSGDEKYAGNTTE